MNRFISTEILSFENITWSTKSLSRLITVPAPLTMDAHCVHQKGSLKMVFT